MKKLFFLLFTLVLLSSCDKDDSNFKNDQRFSIFKENFSDISNFINYENIQTYKEEVLQKTKSDGNSYDFYTFPLMNGNEVFGRFYGYDNGEESIYIDFLDYKNEIVIYNVNDPTQKVVIKMTLDETGKNYIPVISQKSLFWCRASCTLGTMAISASDGPAPLMDVIAVAYFTACMTDCGV